MSRTLFGIGCLVAGAVIAANVTTSAQQKSPDQTPDSVDSKMAAFLDCGKLCDDCTRICELSSSHCVQMIVDGNKDCLPIMKACQDCADDLLRDLANRYQEWAMHRHNLHELR